MRGVWFNKEDEKIINEIFDKWDGLFGRPAKD